MVIVGGNVVIVVGGAQWCDCGRRLWLVLHISGDCGR